MKYKVRAIVAKSQIPDAGEGLFAIEHIRRGEMIVPITGPRLTAKEIEEFHSYNDYLLEINDGTGDCINMDGEARYANDANGISKIEGIANNAGFYSADDHSMYMEATRDILKGEEIFVAYGFNYWREKRKELLETEAVE